MIRTFCIIFLLFLFGCAEVPDFSDIPKLEFSGIRENMIFQSIDRDTVFIELYVEDANGDIGGEVIVDPAIYMIDQRDNAIAFTFQLPKIPDEGTGNGIAADITLRAITNKGDQCCIFPNGQSPCTESDEYPMDTVYYNTYLIDHAGHESNHVTVGPIFIRCDAP